MVNAVGTRWDYLISLRPPNDADSSSNGGASLSGIITSSRRETWERSSTVERLAEDQRVAGATPAVPTMISNHPGFPDGWKTDNYESIQIQYAWIQDKKT